MSVLPLEGIRVIDLSRVIAGPMAASYLARCGADVIKVETTEHLDSARTVIFTDSQEGVNRSGFFNIINAGKKSCALNMNKPEGIDLLKRLIKTSDVVIENFRPKISFKFGLDYGSLRNIKPNLIVASVLGFSRSGSEKDYLAYGRNLHAAGGQTWLIGYPGAEPRGLTGQWADTLSAMMLTYLILSGLEFRRKTGRGQYIDFTMTEAVTALLPEPILDYVMNGRDWKCSGNRSHFAAPHNCYRCKGDDNWIAIAVFSDVEWKALCKAMGNPSWVRDAKFADEYSRWENQEELDILITTWTKNHTDYELMRILQKAGITAGPTLNALTMASDSHLKSRSFFREVSHPEVGVKNILGLPWRINGETEVNIAHAPLIGEHNAYVFKQLLGLSQDEIDDLVKYNIICDIQYIDHGKQLANQHNTGAVDM